jgi:hypothetical protein
LPISTGSRLRIFRPAHLLLSAFPRLLCIAASAKRAYDCPRRRRADLREGRRQLPQSRRSGLRRIVLSNRQGPPSNRAVMLRDFAAALLGVFCLGTTAALALDCFPHCDFYNNYGPYVLGPSLYCNPRCDLQGNCTPFPVCKQQSHGIHKSNSATASPCLPDASQCTSNYQCCSGSCNWSAAAHAYFCGSGSPFSKHPPRPSQ